MKKVLLFGGSFDPPHTSHVDFPRAALECLGFDSVLYVPANKSPLKDRELTAAAHRLAMLELVLKKAPWAEISTIELDRQGTSFTIETIESLMNDRTLLRLLIGADQWEQFPSWKRYEEIIELADPIIMPRMGCDNAHSRVLPIEPMPAASSSIRDKISRGEPFTPLVAPEVAQYIAKHNLYQ